MEQIDQYINLWKDYGIDDVDWSTMKARAKNPGQKSKPPLVSDEIVGGSLNEIHATLGDCTRCKLSKGRNKIVFGTGNPKATLMFVGEGPGAEEDLQGLPFVGRSGKLLTKIIEAMGLDRNDVFIANVVKCRPPDNRAPMPDEVAACTPFLKAQIEAVSPKLVVGLGLPASTYLLGSTTSMASVRGQIHDLAWNPKIKVIPTYHPAYLLRNPPAKKFVWADMKTAMKYLNGSH